MKWLDHIFGSSTNIEYLPMNYCEGKTDEELVETLYRTISLASGQMIVTELLSRLVKRNKNER